MKLYGITGFARSGKDTIAAHMVDRYGYTRLAFADPMRQMLYAINPIVTRSSCGPDGSGYVSPIDFRVSHIVDELGWDVAKVNYPEIRVLLQRLGTEGGRAIFGDTFWTDILLKKAKATNGKVVISDVRFADECVAIRENGGKVIRVTRPGVTSVNNHITDARLPDAAVDFEVQNDGTIEDLEGKIDSIVATASAYARTL